MTHTPTPWRLTYINTGITLAIVGPKRELVTPKNSGEFIVEVCNAHESIKSQRDLLFEALENLVVDNQPVVENSPHCECREAPFSDSEARRCAFHGAKEAIAMCEKGK